jgi:hypothetical protein
VTRTIGVPIVDSTVARRLLSFATVALLVIGCGAKGRGDPAPRASAGGAGSSKRAADRASAEPERRPAVTLHLRGNGAHPAVDRAMPASKYVDHDVIQIQPGEAFTVAGTVQGDRLVHVHRVPFAPQAKDTLTISFKQEGDMMMLIVESGFSRAVTYTTEMQVPDRPAPLHTSACPVRAKLMTTESWPHPILSMFVKDFALLPAGGSAPCK